MLLNFHLKILDELQMVTAEDASPALAESS